ncbi:MAG: PRC-barrel domain-containing protein [Candidatus Bathyarchaeota archaeon]|nr:PRC-barrel domain-containing protein [Candidatus Bathyarchaeota archaeon]
MVSLDKLKGTDVYARRGVKIGKVEDVEVDDNNWSVKVVDVKMNEDVAKIYGEKAGFLEKKIVPLPAEKMGPIHEDNITLKEEFTDAEFEKLRSDIRTERHW